MLLCCWVWVDSGCRRLLGGGDDLADQRRELRYARARDYDRIAAAMRLLGDAEKSAALIFAVFDKEVFALNLKFARSDDVFHSRWGGCSLLLLDKERTPIAELKQIVNTNLAARRPCETARSTTVSGGRKCPVRRFCGCLPGSREGRNGIPCA